MAIRKLLRNKIRVVYRTQDAAAYEMKIDSSILSRVINCTKDPTKEQILVLCNYLKMKKKEVLKKDE